MSESTVLSIRPVRTHTVTVPGTSSSGTIADVGAPDFSTGRRSRSTTSILTGSSQPELTINRLSGKLGAHHPSDRARTPVINQPHRLLLELFPGGVKQFLSAQQARAMLAMCTTHRIKSYARRGRVGRAHCCARPPSEPDVHVSMHPAQASPMGSLAGRSAGLLRFPADCRWQ